MNSYNNVLRISLIALVVIIVIHLLFNNPNNNNPDSNNITTKESFDQIKHKASNYAQKRKQIYKKIKRCNTSSCPVDQSIKDDDIYLQKYLLSAPLGPQKCTNSCNNCVKNSVYSNNDLESKNSNYFDNECCSNSDPSRSCTNCTRTDVCNITENAPKSTKEFSDDFFGFRDSTLMNSSLRFDPVDKIQDLYLNNSMEHAGKFPENIKIKDLFDCATSGPSLYKKPTVRLPSFDNLNPIDQYIVPGTPGLHGTRDQWNYPNEKIMNGGEIENGIYGVNEMGSYSDKYMPTTRYN